jgi:hypothetical protein
MLGVRDSGNKDPLLKQRYCHLEGGMLHKLCHGSMHKKVKHHRFNLWSVPSGESGTSEESKKSSTTLRGDTLKY